MASQCTEKFVLVWHVLCLIPMLIYEYTKAIVWHLTPRRFTKRKDITGQTVLITGAGSGIGRQMAIKFSAHSVSLVLMDLNRPSLLDTEKLLDPRSKAFLYECDVSDRNLVYEVSRKVKKEVGAVDILVNNAGIVTGKKFMHLPDEKIVKTMQVNTLAHFWTVKAFLPEMLERGTGHLVSVSSQAGLCGLPLLTDYCSSKYGAVGFLESLRMELDAQGNQDLKTTIVCPTLIQTGLFEGTSKPLSVLLDPEYVAEEVVAGVLANEEMIILPRWMFLILLLKWLMPTNVTKAFCRKAGLLTFMDTFTGRQPEKNSNGLPTPTDFVPSTTKSS